MKKVINITLVLIFTLSYNGFGQISHFSQFYSSPLTIAPSFAGMSGSSRIGFNYRDQWPKIPGTFVTYALAADHYFPKAKSGLGFLAYRDQAGTGNLSLTDLGVQYSYKLKVGENRGYKRREWFLQPGITFKYSQRALDFYKLTFGDMYNLDGTLRVEGTTESPPNAKTGYIDFAASLLAYNEDMWGGFTVDHLLMPNQSLTNGVAKVPIKIAVFGGYKYLVNRKRGRVRYGEEPENVTFAFHYRAQNVYDQLDLGAYWNRDPFTLGLWVRGLPVFSKSKSTYGGIDAVILLVGYKINEKLKVGYSYDITVSSLLSHTGGANEISIVYLFNQNLLLQKKHRHAIIPCPSF